MDQYQLPSLCLDKILLIIAAAIGFQLTRWAYRNYKYSVIINRIPGFAAIPLIGNIRLCLNAKLATNETLDMMNVTHEICQGLCEIFQKEKIFRVWLAGSAFVFVYGSKTVQPVMTCKVYEKSDFLYSFTKAIFGIKSLLICRRKIWLARRKMINPTFNNRKLIELMPSLNRKCHRLVEIINAKMEECSLEISPLIAPFTLDVFSEIVLGSNDNSQDNADTLSILKNMKDSSYYIIRRLLKPWLWFDLVYKNTNEGKEYLRVVSGVNEVTAKEMRERSGNANVDKERGSLLDLLMENHSEDSTSSLKDVQKELNLFMIAGQDTTHLNLVYTLYLLGLDQEIQGKIYEEIRRMYPILNPSVTNDEIQRLTYLDMVIKESLRLFPAIPAITRKLDEDIQIGNYVIPKGTAIVINIFKLHRDPDVFPNPEKFNPDRFAEVNCKNITPFNYMPFSFGPRNCIGKQVATLTVKVLLIHLLLNFKVESLVPRDKILLSPAITLKSKFPIRLKFHRRNTNIS